MPFVHFEGHTKLFILHSVSTSHLFHIHHVYFLNNTFHLEGHAILCMPIDIFLSKQMNGVLGQVPVQR